MRFDELGLSESVLKAVTEAGYETPTPIQEKAIPLVLQRRDVLGIAQTGTGKTAGFTLPMIDMLAKGRARARMPRSLILEPTRELAAQVSENFEKYGKYNKLSMALLIGGVSFTDQERKLDRGVDVLIATPGRLIDHFERGKVMLQGVEILVIDEADRMLDMGFIPDIERIVKLLPFTRQTLFFSATMPPEITRLADAFLTLPARVEVSKPASTADTVTQRHLRVRGADKLDALRKLLRAEDVKNAIIFCNRKRDVSIVHKALAKTGFNAAALHGDLDQRTRQQTLDAFRNDEVTFLVASDVAARGLDIPAVSHIFNFDVPVHSEDYVHRIGRTGRAGREGKAFTLVTAGEVKYLRDIEKLIGKDIEQAELEGMAAPTAEETAEAEDGARRRRGGRGGSGRSRAARGDEAPRRQQPRAKADASGTGDKPEKKEEAATPAKAETAKPDSPKGKDRDRPPRREGSDSRNARKGQPRKDARQDQRKGRERGRRGHDDDDGRPVQGLGDHTPAFLLRPALPADDDGASKRKSEKQNSSAA